MDSVIRSMPLEDMVYLVYKHDVSPTHKSAMSRWSSFLHDNDRGTSIGHYLDKSQKELIQNNRHYIRSLCEIILLCARQDFALRGHKETLQSQNCGNFLKYYSFMLVMI